MAEEKIRESEWWKNQHEQFKDDPVYQLYDETNNLTEAACLARERLGLSYKRWAKLAGVSRKRLRRFLGDSDGVDLPSTAKILAAVGLKLRMQAEERKPEAPKSSAPRPQRPRRMGNFLKRGICCR